MKNLMNSIKVKLYLVIALFVFVLPGLAFSKEKTEFYQGTLNTVCSKYKPAYEYMQQEGAVQNINSSTVTMLNAKDVTLITFSDNQGKFFVWFYVIETDSMCLIGRGKESLW